MQKSKNNPRQNNTNKNYITNLYSNTILCRTVILGFDFTGENLVKNLEKNLKLQYEGKCTIEGYVKPGSIQKIQYSCGTIVRGNLVQFQVNFECQVCFLAEKCMFQCIAKNITKAGIKAESVEQPSPVIVFIARDNHFKSKLFNSIKEGDIFTVKVLGQQFELNDDFVSIIGSIVNPNLQKLEKTEK